MKPYPFVYIKPEVCLSTILVLLFLPLPMAAGWYLAVIIHETSHYLALRLCGCEVSHILVSGSGAEMETNLSGGWKELICSCAGPLGSLVLVLFARVFPYLAICGLIQFLFNMIPLYPLDGGRICHCLIDLISPHKLNPGLFLLIQKIVKILLVCVSLILAVGCKLGMMPIILVAFFLLRYRRNSP